MGTLSKKNTSTNFYAYI